MKVTVIDYGLSNLRSVPPCAVPTVGAEAVLTGERGGRAWPPKALVLPGVGAFRDGMAGAGTAGPGGGHPAEGRGGYPAAGHLPWHADAV